MTSLKYTNKIKQLFKEAENQFTSTINTKMPGKEEQSATLISPTIEPNAIEQSQQEKAALTAKAMEKVKQSLEVSDELQSILNKIDKINKDVNANKWQLNDKDNTAYLPSKNAQIFKQNNYLCLSYDDRVELFNSVGELHDFLRKHNIPLPQNIKLHEATIKPGIGAFKQLWGQFLSDNYADNTLTPEERETRNDAAFKPMTKKSREEYIQAMRNPEELGVRRLDGGPLEIMDITKPGEWKKVKPDNETPKKECGATVGGSIGSAVQYTGDKLNEEELQEVTPADKGWKPGIMYDKTSQRFLRPDEVNPKNPNHVDWTTFKTNRADEFAPLWFKWISAHINGQNTEFYPDRDPNFIANAHNYIKTKHNPTTRSERETTSWRKQLWDKHLEKNAWLDPMKTTPNPRYGELNMTNAELKKMAQDFKDKGYGDLLNGLDPNDPNLNKKFHPVSVPRMKGANNRQWIGPNDDPNAKELSGMVYNANINPEVRARWYDMKGREGRINDEDKLLDHLAKRVNMSSKDYYDKYITNDILPIEQDSFKGLRKISTPTVTNTEISIDDLQKRALAKMASKMAKESTEFSKTFLNLRQKKKDIPLQEDDSPADFATGQSAIASDMTGATDTASDMNTATTDLNTGDYAADPTTGAPFNNTPGFGDINIDAGNGDYSPDVAQQATPMPEMPQYKIIDVLVDENDPTKLKVRVKNKETGKVEVKDLSEIDV